MAAPYPLPISQKTTKPIGDIQPSVLHLFPAYPEQSNIFFSIKTTGEIKPVLDVFTAQKGSSVYRYHVDAHSSLIGVRELARETTCFSSDAVVKIWLKGLHVRRTYQESFHGGHNLTLPEGDC